MEQLGSKWQPDRRQRRVLFRCRQVELGRTDFSFIQGKKPPS
jgi:hypothetical protein